MYRNILSISILLFFSCSGETLQEEKGENTDLSVIQTESEAELVELTLDTENSTADWTRILDQKATRKKMKMFGAMVDVELGPVMMDMSGNVQLTSGSLFQLEGQYSKGKVVFDMATFKFPEEKGQGLFDTYEYPNSTLEFLSFWSDMSGQLMAHSRLTIQDHSQEMDIMLDMVKGADHHLMGEFTFNTLDFPLREQVDAEAVNKDEVTVILDLLFEQSVAQ